MLDKAKVKKIASDYSDDVKKVLNPDKIILFGSYANGNPHEWSDIDIAVLVTNIKNEDWHNKRIELHRICWGKNEFADIEPHLLDETRDPSGFVEHVIKTGEIIYQAV